MLSGEVYENEDEEGLREKRYKPPAGACLDSCGFQGGTTPWHPRSGVATALAPRA